MPKLDKRGRRYKAKKPKNDRARKKKKKAASTSVTPPAYNHLSCDSTSTSFLESIGTSHDEESFVLSDGCTPLSPVPMVTGSTTNENVIVHAPAGRRIIDIQYFLTALIKLENHGPFDCRLKDMEMTREWRNGLISVFNFKCKVCNFKSEVKSIDTSSGKMDVNTAAVTGALAVGIGHGQLEELCSTMDLPFLSEKKYRKTEISVGCKLLETAGEEMEAAASEEARLARELGDVDQNGIPLVAVTADGCWAKRSYRNQYNSLSGAAAIIGCRTQKVLYLAVKNKYCTVCARAQSKEVEVPEHQCFRNWTSSSSSMESAAILEGFQRSVEMYGIIYNKLIADGDSSTYNKLLEMRPYPTVSIEKVECRNHLFRNYCQNLRSLAANTHAGPKHLRKIIENNVLRLRTAANRASFHWKNETGSLEHRISQLRLEIMHSPHHVFGDHSKCADRYCDATKKQGENYVPEMINSGLWNKMRPTVSRLADNSRSLIQRLTSNAVENFNSIIAKHIGGKRINFCGRGGYHHRVMGAVVSHNSRSLQSRLHKTMYRSSPGVFVKKMEMKHKRRLELEHKRRERTQNFRRRQLFPGALHNPGDYGPHANKPDVSASELEEKKNIFLAELQLNDEDRKNLERNTVGQSADMRWREERRKRLTASNFGEVCRRKSTTPCAKLVARLLYKNEFTTQATAYGKAMESVAIQHLEEQFVIAVEPCGLFVDREFPFLGASPDGLIGENGIVEVKCPSSAKDMTPEEAVASKKFPMWSMNNTGGVDINKKHRYFYQIQGELHVSQRQECFCVLFTNKDPFIMVKIIEKEDDFWETQMLPKLQQFYLECILPEIVDSRQSRSMSIREPEYIAAAQNKNTISIHDDE